MAISETELANLAAGLISAQAIVISALATTSDIGTKVMPALNISAANGPLTPHLGGAGAPDGSLRRGLEY